MKGRVSIPHSPFNVAYISLISTSQQISTGGFYSEKVLTIFSVKPSQQKQKFKRGLQPVIIKEVVHLITFDIVFNRYIFQEVSDCEKMNRISEKHCFHLCMSLFSLL